MSKRDLFKIVGGPFEKDGDYVLETRSSGTFSKILSRISRSLCRNLDNGSWLAAGGTSLSEGAVPNFRSGNARECRDSCLL